MSLSSQFQSIADDPDSETASGTLFLTSTPEYFSDKISVWHRIRQNVARTFGTRIIDIKCCGSAQLGYSPFKNREFEPGASDLDIAIVSSYLFSKYLDWVIDKTDRFSDLSDFPRQAGRDTSRVFVDYAGKRGILRPDLLPFGELKTNWFRFFERLSSEYKDHFSKISAGIYLSEACFASKQIDAVDLLRRKTMS